MTSKNSDNSKKAETIADIRRVCRPSPLEGEALKNFFVETDSARDPYQHTRQRIKDILEIRSESRILFYGHRGCGKSTELNKLVSEIGDRYFTVNFSVQDEMSPVAIRAEDLILVIMHRVLKYAQSAGLNMSEDLLNPVFDFFNQTTITRKAGRDSCAEAGGGVDTKSGVLGNLIGLFAKFRAEIKLNVHSDETTVAILRKRPADLLTQANMVIEAVSEALPEGKRLLVIVEDLDKLDLKQAREIYVNNVSLLTGIIANIIYTIPIFLFHSPDVDSFKHGFDDAINMPMIKVTEPGKTDPCPGFETIREIIRKRVSDELIDEGALKHLILMTGGVLRYAFEVLHRTALMANVSAPIEKEQVDYGLQQLRKEFWQQVALPYDKLPGGPETVEELYDRLEEYGSNQNKGNKNPPKTDAINQILLKACAIVEYNGEGWFGVHPLVIENLKTLGRFSEP